MLNPIEGEIFYVDKPLRWTSFDAVKRVRGAHIPDIELITESE